LGDYLAICLALRTIKNEASTLSNETIREGDPRALVTFAPGFHGVFIHENLDEEIEIREIFADFKQI
jgi:hypothetical protein